MKTVVPAFELDRAPLVRGEPVDEALLPELEPVMLAEPLDRDAEVVAALPDAVVVPAPAAPVDDAAAVELPEPTVDPLTMES